MVAQSVGTGLGLLLRPRVVAMIGTISMTRVGGHEITIGEPVGQAGWRGTELPYAGRTAMASMETNSPRGSVTLAGAERAGGGSGM